MQAVDADSVVDQARAAGLAADQIAVYDRIRAQRHHHKGDADFLTGRERAAFEDVLLALEAGRRAKGGTDVTGLSSASV